MSKENAQNNQMEGKATTPTQENPQRNKSITLRKTLRASPDDRQDEAPSETSAEAVNSRSGELLRALARDIERRKPLVESLERKGLRIYNGRE
jgi:hypothetical protein